MKEITLPAQINMFFTNILDALVAEQKTPIRSHSGKEPLKGKRNRPQRREFFYYTQVVEDETRQVVGHLSDISSGGFKLDSQQQIPVNKDFQFRLNLTSEVADKPFMLFTARSRWCRIDPIDPYVYNIGFQLIHISPGDLEIFNRMMERYGREYNNRLIDLRRSNKW
jgi:hypothetical protein